MNWGAIFNRVFEIINTQDDAYYSGTRFLDTILHIPSSSQSKYAIANGWKEFFNIQEDTGIAPKITTTTLPNGIINTTYSVTLTATGDTTITWSIDNGNLPNGLNLSANGVISGTSTTAGTFSFIVKATNNAGSDTKALSIIITTGGRLHRFFRFLFQEKN